MPRITLLRLMFSFSACATPAEDTAVDTAPPPEVGFTGFRDADGDGYGDPASPVTGYPRPDDAVGNDRDCNDSDPDTWPGVTERHNGLDDDCDGAVDEGVPPELCNGLDDDGDGWIDEAPVDGWTFWPDRDRDLAGDASQAGVVACEPPGDDWWLVPGDCDDSDPRVGPVLGVPCVEEDRR